jgi:hypothetical protein
MKCAIPGDDGGKGECLWDATKNVKNGLNGLKRGAAHAIGLETCSKFARVKKGAAEMIVCFFWENRTSSELEENEKKTTTAT